MPRRRPASRGRRASLGHRQRGTLQAWLDNGGQIIALSPEDRGGMMARFAEVGGGVLRSNDAVAAEYERLPKVVKEMH